MTAEVNLHILQMVIVKDPLVDTLTGGSVVVNLLELFRTACDVRIKAQIFIQLGADDSPIGRFSAFAGCLLLPDGKGTSPFVSVFTAVIAPVVHTPALLADRSSIGIKRDVPDWCLVLATFVQVNECPGIVDLKKLIGGIIVMGRIQAEVVDMQSRLMPAEFIQSKEDIHRVMPLRGCIPEQERQVNRIPAVMV